ncbi:GSCOCT00014054001.2-RA-CDS, partial [Cotesia congregata]
RKKTIKMQLRDSTNPSVSTLSSRAFAFLYYGVFKVLGLSTWWCDLDKLIELELEVNFYNLEYEITFNQMYYNVILGVYMTYLNYNYFVYERGYFPKNIGLMSDGAVKYCQGISLESYWIVLMIYMFKQHVHVNILNRMTGIDAKLLEVSGRKVKNGFMIYFMFLFHFSMTIALIVLKAIDLYDKPYEQWFVTVMPSIFYSWMVLHYILSLDFLLSRIRMINRIAKNANYGDKLSFGTVIKLSDQKKTINDEIESVTEVFDELADMVAGLAKFYELPLFIAALNALGIATFIIYYIHSWHQGDTTIKSSELIIYQLCLSTIIIEVLLLTFYYLTVQKKVTHFLI